jgi:hypothetical protein
MLTRSRRLVAAAVVCAALASVTTACGGGDGGGAKAWDDAAVKDARAAGALVASKLPGECGDVAVADHATYAENAKRIGGPVPHAVATCTVSGEAVEISAFEDAKARDSFVEKRTQRLCDASTGRNRLHGLRWVVAGAWAMQPDTQALGTRLAEGLGAKYEPVECDGQTLDWSAEDVAHVEELAGKLHDGGLGCDELTLQNRDQLAVDAHYVSVGLPGAYGQCTAADGAALLVGSYRDTQTLLGDFIPLELSFLCDGSKRTQAIVGDDWSLTTSSGADAQAMADALGGDVLGGCRT